ncbi:MAG: ATP-binding protein [Bulleidia sp.]
MLYWSGKNCHGNKAILIEGARRIGKSTIAEEFARSEYASYLIIDFALHDKDVEEYFEKYMSDPDTLFMMLQGHYGVNLKHRDSLIIFDEVQMFPRARAAIKYLVADGRYDYLETGSLISIHENVKDIVIPSEERHIAMYPMDFEEFCLALGQEALIEYIRKCFTERVPLEKGLHDKAILVFKQYILVGGMPKAVSAFIENQKSFAAADIEKRDILALYRADIMKINARYRSKVLAVFDQIPGLLSKHEKRVAFNKIQADSTADQYEETFFWLSDSMISNECFRCANPDAGLSLNEERSYIKCYLGDTGLLVSYAFDENALLEEEVYKKILTGKLSMNQGMLYENAIAQMLTASGHKLYFYSHYSESQHRNDIEIDFLISNNSKLKYKIYPIEVKSAKQYKTVSLNRFKEKFRNRIGECYIIHPKNLSIRDDVLCLPPYMAWLL